MNPYHARHGHGQRRSGFDDRDLYEPRHSPTARCPRCTEVGASGFLCDPCAGEVQANRAEARDEIVATVYTNFGSVHDYRPDVTR